MAKPRNDTDLLQLPATILRESIATGAVRVVDLAKACIARIEAREPEIQAWAWFDAKWVLDQAAALDAYRASGRPIGRLHGLPVGIKDIIDTSGIPTENGTTVDAGRIPTKDAYVVTRLKQAGALIMGKTTTTELALFTPSKTRNPHDPTRTPGGSSAGSAAVVAARMIPLAIGTQTAGSVIRPASYCGVVGYKPTFGAIPRSGILQQAPSLDTVGVFANSPEDAALLADALCGYDADDPASSASPAPRLFDTAQSEPFLTPEIAFVAPPGWDTAEEQTRAACEELRVALGEHCSEVALPEVFDQSNALREQLQLAELAKSFFTYERRGRDQISPGLRQAIDQGKAVLARDYLAARDWQGIYNALLDEIFTRFDVILTAAAPGPAPAGLESTGSPIFNGLWTFCGTPAITLPLLATHDGLPIGVQLIGRRGDDGRLLRTARWLVSHLAKQAAT